MKISSKMNFLHSLCLLLVLHAKISYCADEDFYELFGVAKDATNQEIRKAFKKLAVTMHPDKNPDDPDADSKFIKVTQAYEILKDPESRKQYDLYGFDSVKSNVRQPNYQSWSYYQDQFGIYDDDPEVITLSQSDFDNSVLKSGSLWFINFYSPMCSHCHHVAPSWRRLARGLKGVARVGAVNCDEDWTLCRQEGVRSYPTLILYPAKEFFDGDRNVEEMTSFVLKHLVVDIHRMENYRWQQDEFWVFYLCGPRCPPDNERTKVAAILSGLVEIGEVSWRHDYLLCELLGSGTCPNTPTIFYWQPKTGELPEGSHKLHPGDAQQVANQVLALLPDTPLLDADAFDKMMARLNQGASTPWLIHFDIGATTQEDLEWRRLPALTPGIKVGRVHCGRLAPLCGLMHVRKYPTFALFKSGGGYEVHHGRTSAHDVADFARDSAKAPNVRSVTPKEFPNILQDFAKAWVIDFYAPWCPPCLRLLPELRSASRAVGSGVSFGLVDCTVHTALCRAQEVSSYPTTVLYNNTRVKQRYLGDNSAEGIMEFLQDMINPVVVHLTIQNFYSTVGNKGEKELWLVDFFAPWCGPCQQLAPEWRKLAKMLLTFEYVRVGSVDCVAETKLCGEQAVRSYPTVRLYPLGSEGLSSVALFSGYQRDAHTLRSWVFNFLPSTVEELDAETFQTKVVRGDDTWLVDFYTPWCGHCTVFEPEFITVAERLKNKVKCGKLNCESYRYLCQHAGVYGYPSVVLYHGAQRGGDGTKIPSQVGDEIVSRVQAVLADAPAIRHDEF